MRPDLLERVGRALYGTQWQSALARDLGINDRTMRRWVADGAPERIAPELLVIVRKRGAELETFAYMLMPPPSP